MLQLKNNTPFQASFFVFPDTNGIDTLYVVVKATFGLYPSVRVAKEQIPVTLADEYWGEPGTSSIKYASEAHLGKVGTDVVVVGEACSARDQPVPMLEVEIRIAEKVHGAKVFGDREWKPGLLGLRLSEPKPFMRMPLTYERAYGGTQVIDEISGEFLAEPQNPVGKGFKGKKWLSKAGVGAPNIESVTEGRKLAGFGFVAPSWEPRIKFAGTYDQEWQKNKAPYLPEDFDPRYFNMAPPELTFPEPLMGGEDVFIKNMSERKVQRFTLPACDIRVSVTMSGKVQTPRPVLETVLIEPTSERMSLSYRTSVGCDKKILEISEMIIECGSLPT